jgi:hypothetical protein
MKTKEWQGNNAKGIRNKKCGERGQLTISAPNSTRHAFKVKYSI